MSLIPKIKPVESGKKSYNNPDIVRNIPGADINIEQF
jgi:hypothetical protein